MAESKSQSKNWNKLKDAVMNKHAERLNALLTTAEDEEFALNYFKLLEYIQPKLQRTEIKQESEDEITLKINYVKSTDDEERKDAKEDTKEELERDS